MEPHDRDRVRWGIAGTGKIARRFGADLALVHDAELVAVSSADPARSVDVAAEVGAHRSHRSHEELFAADDIDVVYVAGLHPKHVPHAVAAMEAGRHVLVEKPLALDTAGVDLIASTAERTGRFCMEAMWMRFNPTHRAVMARLEAGQIGEVRRVVADFSIDVGVDPTHRLLDRSVGGGGLVDLGIYPLHLAWWALGAPLTMTATGTLGPTGVDIEAALTCGWEGGATAFLTCAVALGGTLAARIEGSDGAVDFGVPGHACETATVTSGNARSGGRVVEEIRGEAAGLHHQVVEVHRCLRAGEAESPHMPLALSRAVIAQLDQARAAIGVQYD